VSEMAKSNSQDTTSVGMNEQQLPSGVEFEPPLRDAHDAARFLGIHPVTLCELARQGRIPAIKVGKAWRFRPLSLKRWLDSQEQREQNER